ncbi:protein Iojap, chloroplastic [Macadamia integrifolia]|uniref:protein Iojap, chloroplastic n=1 Tax=Macadamia integrifolia TaxID=60698 RepID=UPI001C4FD008|nr:protein Iojap, chloroplastic [Macadamia integrifolia]
MASAFVSTSFPIYRASCINFAMFRLQLQSNLKPFQKKTCSQEWHQLTVKRRDKAESINIPKAMKPSGSEDEDVQNLIEDTDAMFDDLLEKYGKVVYRSKDKKSPSAEADDDAESLSFAVALAKVASEVKAADIRVLFVKPLVYWTRFFIIATAFSRPQIDAIGSKIRDLAEKQYRKVASGDTKPNSWTLLDFGDVVVHIFLPQQRALYNLEEFYGNATLIELPFENQSSIRS